MKDKNKYVISDSYIGTDIKNPFGPNTISTYNIEPSLYEFYSKYYPEVFVKVEVKEKK